MFDVSTSARPLHACAATTALPEPTRAAAMEQLEAEIARRVRARLAERLRPADAAELRRCVLRDDESAAVVVLTRALPDYRALVVSEIAAVLADLGALTPAPTAAPAVIGARCRLRGAAPPGRRR